MPGRSGACAPVPSNQGTGTAVNLQLAVYESLKNAISHAREVIAKHEGKKRTVTQAQRVGIFVTSLRTHLIHTTVELDRPDPFKRELANARANLLKVDAWEDVGVLKKGNRVDYSTINRLATKAMSATPGTIGLPGK